MTVEEGESLTDTTFCVSMKKKKLTTEHMMAANSTIDLTLANLMIVAPEYKLSKEYELKGSDHSP